MKPSKLQAPHNMFAHVSELLNPDFKAVKSPDIRFGVSDMDSFYGSLFTQGHFYLVFYSKFTNNILVFTAANDFLCMLELEQAPAKTYDVSKNWRIVFKFQDGNIYVVDYEDYH